MSYVIQLSHIVINTKNREKTLSQDNKTDLFKYIWGIVTNKNCRLYRINGIENHIHMFIGIHQSISLMELVREIKRSSSIWIKQSGNSPKFDGWSKEYAAFSVSWEAKDSVINYIKNQEEHHRVISFDDEYKSILQQHEINEYISPQ